ncbi:hypothetical protein [Enterococcus dispar]|uniref:hypothetical protein n=1 Tax=Enterococcus dispar TaxID=44009 RepID=UPI0021D47F7A|nr:hypothetical protein [Enterococcus dispar]MCU7356819.1 hypothetical protein [Enterococcus dispar]MDT2704920.1 hypothetical protein [Enterococcus dispar]
MVETTEQFTMKELDILKHDDLRKFAVDQGIEIPVDITTKKALVPYLYEILNKPPEVDEQEQSEKKIDEAENQTDEDASDQEPRSAEDDLEETDSDQETAETEDEADRYIRTETSNGVLVYDRKTHSAVMEPRG